MKRLKTDILIIIEHKVRELESACLLKYEYEKRGYSVVIEGIYPNKEYLPLKYEVKYIIIPWAYNDRDMEYFKCFYKYSPNAIFINLHHEQYSGHDDKNICLPSGEAVKIYHISWGNKFTQGLLSRGCKLKDIYTVGNIKLDMFKKDLKKMFLTKEKLSKKYNLNQRKKWILFIANGYHLMSDKKIESIRQLDNEIDIKKNVATENRKEYLNYVEKYLENKKDVVFIYRPHPVYANLEFKDNIIKNLLKKYPNNFYLIPDLTIGNWIVNVDVCISFHSTSGIECCMANTPYYLFRKEELRADLDYPFFNDYKYTIKNYKDFNKAINAKDYDSLILKNAISDYYLIDEEYTYKKIVDSSLNCKINKLSNNSFKSNFKNRFRAFIKNSLIFLSKISLFKKIILSFDDNRIYKIIEKNEDDFDENDILDILGKIDKIERKGEYDE